MNHQVIFGGLALLLFLIFKSAYAIANVADLHFLLLPPAYFLKLFLASPYIFQSGTGYYFPALHIIIDKSCAGFNWWMLAFLISYYAVLKTALKPKILLLFLPITLLLSYILSLLVNSTRIILSVFIESQVKFQFEYLHLMEGIFVYLGFLMLWNLFCQYYSKKFLIPQL